jgi:hypothetical protein
MSEKNCTSPIFLERLCKLFPYQSMKITFLSLELVAELLENTDLNLRILYIVRDPRGSLASSMNIFGSQRNATDPSQFCKQQVSDYVQSKNMIIKFKNRFQIVRYEDISQNVFAASHSIIKFLNLKRNSVTDTFIDKMHSHGIPDIDMWKSKLTFSEIKNIQDHCGEAMQLWGYNAFQNKFQLKMDEAFESRQVFYQRLYF